MNAKNTDIGYFYNQEQCGSAWSMVLHTVAHHRNPYNSMMSIFSSEQRDQSRQQSQASIFLQSKKQNGGQ